MSKKTINILFIALFVCALNLKKPDEYFLDRFISGTLIHHNKKNLHETLDSYHNLRPYVEQCDWGYYFSLGLREGGFSPKVGIIIRF